MKVLFKYLKPKDYILRQRITRYTANAMIMIAETAIINQEVDDNPGEFQSLIHRLQAKDHLR